jgi:hypothetical protein
MTMMASELRDFARQLLAREGQEGGSGKDGLVAIRVCNKLRRALSKLIGLAAFRAFLFRALVLAKAETSCLDAIQVAQDGSLTGLAEMEAEWPKKAAEGEVTLIAHLIGLLIALIGRALTISLVQGIWPDVSFDAPKSPTEQR